ncbi:MAG: GNAT family protein [Pseudomonadota bacterium]
MTLFRSISTTPGPQIESERCYARAPEDRDYTQWSSLRGESHEFLQPYEPRWPLDELTRPAFRRRLRRYAQDARDRQGYAFFIFDQKASKLLGGLTLSNVRYGVSQSCSLGYWMGEPHAGQGYMSEVLPALFPFVFGELGLHRIEAACLPDNKASMRLLNRCGFHEEGLAKSYLKIDGRWQDHRLFAKVSPL